MIIALVELAEGPRLLTNIVGTEPDPERLPLDAALRVEFEPREEQVLPVFRIQEQASLGDGSRA